MTPKPKFDLDLRYGQGREDALAHLLMSVKVEVKSDRKCRHTGNLAVEYEQICGDGEKRPSGLSTTEADVYAFEYDTDHWLLVTTEVVKTLARRAIDERLHKWIGDNDEHHNALVPLKWFYESPAHELREVA